MKRTSTARLGQVGLELHCGVMSQLITMRSGREGQDGPLALAPVDADVVDAAALAGSKTIPGKLGFDDVVVGRPPAGQSGEDVERQLRGVDDDRGLYGGVRGLRGHCVSLLSSTALLKRRWCQNRSR
jgi:hypothetical protein